MSKMILEKWTAKYQPGERIPFLHDPAVRAADPLTIWTEIESDGNRTIINGKHIVNREAHYICAVPFDEGDFIEVDDTDPEEVGLDDNSDQDSRDMG